MKWSKRLDNYYPTDEICLVNLPEKGVFQVIEEKSGFGNSLIGLKQISKDFSFNFKIYDLGISEIINRVKTTWSSGFYKRSKKNLGIVFNGVRGTGKTIAAKILCNEINLPVILINNYYEGLLEFIQSIDFECIILIDEAEKAFPSNNPEESSVLLRMIDGVYNNSPKIFILTTNTLSINENLIDRPSRIRYIKGFEGLTELAISQIIEDKLVNKSLKDSVINEIKRLKLTTVDIVDNIIMEYNIHGNMIGDNQFNYDTREFITPVISLYFSDIKGNVLSMELLRDINNFLDKTKYNIILTNNVDIKASEVILPKIFNEYIKKSRTKLLEFIGESYDDVKDISLKDFILFIIETKLSRDVYNLRYCGCYLDTIKSWIPEIYVGMKISLNCDDYIISNKVDNLVECVGTDGYEEVKKYCILLE